ncbi:ATP-dependent RNA helicase HrpA [Solemya velum gill symbiont]|uniref:ATP-dependent RNA helicase HrpA n=1 Tax=Solemya velum gill symbiont TaxID=2340 RepID=UPI0009967FCD|nr:ATP-dependent RNA helicase HrpA [Solemya velum gill symbiont]
MEPLLFTSFVSVKLPDQTQFNECLLTDRYRLRRRLHALQKLQRSGSLDSDAVLKLEKEVNVSAVIASQRLQTEFDLDYPADLPVAQRVDEISKTIRDNQVTILCGETGSGKSTQLPKICLELGYGHYGRIGHTQPRRIAARSLASRIASELNTESGQLVGYRVRFKDHLQPHSRIKLMTDGILLAEIQQDPWLNQYDLLIIDEAHERTLNIDFLLGYLKRLLPKRPDLKLIITSATIDPERFSEHFDKAPIIMVSGRTWPVEVRYQPPEEELGTAERDEGVQQAIVDALDELALEDRGDVLVFLSGEREIRETAETLRKHHMDNTEVLPLYARLSPTEQSKIFNPSGQRRIILSTNVAETSLTVPGIRHVVDTGFARISRYSHRSKVQRLPVERVSQASANQRKGRCGRVAEGICIRLYSEEDFESRREFTEPEIQRTNLASVILQMQLMGVGKIEGFPFIDAPDSRLIKDGYLVLTELGSVTPDRKVTRIGKQLARLPVDPRIGRMLLEAAHTHCLNELLVIAASLSIQDPRMRPLEKQQASDEAHALFHDELSDYMAMLNLWRHLEEQKRHLSRRKFNNHCRERFLSSTRVQEWFDIHHQLRGQMHEMGYKESMAESGYEEIHKAILSGLLSHIGFRHSGKEMDYLGARNSRFHLFPGSGVFKKRPKWVVAAELVETTRLYARGVASVEPQWIESMAGHLIKRSYSEPHWQKKRGQVGAYEKVTLYGLTLVQRRRINYGPIDPDLSREIFIRQGLVEEEFETRAPFWRHNHELIASLRDQEARSRQHAILFDEELLFRFYDERIPAGIYSKPDFERWSRNLKGGQGKLLFLSEEDVRPSDALVSKEQFPDSMNINGMQLPLSYRFQPGATDDGVTLTVPQDVLGQVTQAQLEWLVPGLLEERITMMIRGLPKAIRKHFVPVPDFARHCVNELPHAQGSLKLAVARLLGKHAGIHISDTDWQEEKLPEHLQMKIRVVDSDGKKLAHGIDLAAMKRKYARSGQGNQQTSLADASHEIENIKRWEFGDIRQRIKLKRGGIELTAFSALIDCNESVSLKLLESEAIAAAVHRRGLRRLAMLTLPEQTRYLKKAFPGLDKMRLQYAKAICPDGVQQGQSELLDELIAVTIDQVFLHEGLIWKQADFEQAIEQNRSRLAEAANRISALVAEILETYREIRTRLSSLSALNLLSSVNDMQQQLDSLVYRGFIEQTDWQHLQAYPRYLKALLLRLEKLGHAAARDQQQMRVMSNLQQEWQQRYQQMHKDHLQDERIEEIRWMLEELRISLFAQEVKTAYPISIKRIEKRWKELGL